MDWNKFYDKAYSWMLTVGPKILIGIIIILVGLWLIRLLKKWLNNHLFKKEVASSVRPFLVNLVVTLLQIFLFIGFMQIVGLQLTIFTAIVGAFGVAAGLALSGTLQNFTSGILILLLKPFRVGENIIAQGNEGTIEAIQIFFTTLKTYDNRTVVIPNSKLSNEVIVNLSRENKRRIDIEFKLPFAVDMQAAKAVLEKSINGMQGLLKEPEHRIGISSIENDGYKITVNAWSPAHGFIDTRLQLQQRIVEDLKSSDLKLPGL